jgi:predicted  nucleic acid-binding Zn-ribbon protein|tara:strand:+ start:435 stop:926 length:492 start_codon:yes stop_codon:yes gene_type:complete
MTNPTDQAKAVPSWNDFIESNKKRTEIIEARDFARSRQSDCERVIRENDMRLEMLKFVHDILESKKGDFECMNKEEEEIAQKFVGHSYTLDIRNEQLADYLTELEEQKYDLHLAIADASVKRQQYKKESEAANGDLSKLQKKLYEEHCKLEADAKKAQEESKQ